MSTTTRRKCRSEDAAAAVAGFLDAQQRYADLVAGLTREFLDGHEGGSPR